MKAICAGDATRNDVVQSSLEQYRDVYVKTVQQVEVLRRVSERDICSFVYRPS